MHVLIVTDQHPDSLGGAQVAIRAQRSALERAGHTVTVAAPAFHGGRHEHSMVDRDAIITLPSRAVSRDGEYGVSWPTARTDRALARALRSRPPVDVVHIAGDFWGAMIGLRAARGLRVPVVHTMHNNVDQGTRAVTPLAPVVFRLLRLWRALALGRPRGHVDRRARGAWRYLAELAAEARVVVAPSKHFADRLVQHGVAPGIEVIRNGVDDDRVRTLRDLPRVPRSRPQLIWLGRLSREKRVREFLEAVALARIDADVTIYGSGALCAEASEWITQLGLTDTVRLAGPVDYGEALAAIHQADALVQTSFGFETQGLTPFEAAVLGTPTIFTDPLVAADLGVSPHWVAPDPSVAALARTLREAVAQLAAHPGELRVPAAAATEFLQSAQTELLLRQYDDAMAEYTVARPVDPRADPTEAQGGAPASASDARAAVPWAGDGRTRLMFDARYIRTDFHDGISRFSAELSAATARNAAEADVDVVFLIHDEAQRALLPPGASAVRIHPPTSAKEPCSALVLNRYRPDVVFSPMQTIGSFGRRFRLILTLHDTIYYRHRTPPRNLPAVVRLGWRLFHLSYAPQRMVLNGADLVATVSETSKRQFSAVRLTKRPVVVLSNAPQDLAHLLPEASAPRTDGPPRNIIYMGSFMPYKNVETIVRAMGDLPGYTLHLLSRIDDAKRAELTALAAPGANVVFHGGVTDEQYASLLNDRAILATLSLDEGYGLPVAEALAFGVPAVISDLEIFREVAGEGALFVPAQDAAAFAEAVRSLDDDETRGRVIAAGLAQAERFSWDRSARTLLDRVRALAFDRVR